MKVIIIGANGKIGKLVAQKMSASEDYDPIAFIRKEEQIPYFENLGVTTLLESLESSEATIAEALKGAEAIVFTAGSGGATGADKTIEIDLYGAIKVINAAKKVGIHRFVMVGAAFSDVPDYWTAPGMKPYYIAKHLADVALKESGLNYTILRPVLLTDDEAAGSIMITSNPHDLGDEIPRTAVADVILSALPNEKTYGCIMEMSQGTQSIETAISEFSK